MRGLLVESQEGLQGGTQGLAVFRQHFRLRLSLRTGESGLLQAADVVTVINDDGGAHVGFSLLFCSFFGGRGQRAGFLGLQTGTT